MWQAWIIRLWLLAVISKMRVTLYVTFSSPLWLHLSLVLVNFLCCSSVFPLFCFVSWSLSNERLHCKMYSKASDYNKVLVFASDLVIQIRITSAEWKKNWLPGAFTNNSEISSLLIVCELPALGCWPPTADSRRFNLFPHPTPVKGNASTANWGWGEGGDR